ncbi:MAG: glutaredoxin [Fusobacteriales bacterium]|nr:MAG: glutaredoxin [Fusobacteriales bacterium]
MNKFYGSMICADCVEAFEYLDKISYNYEFVNITESVEKMKEFLSLRDNRKEFEEVKKEGYIGIPTILTEDDKLIIGDDVFEIKK